MRTFIRAIKRPLSGVKKWTWTKSHGLRVHFSGGQVWKSEYTLRELLSGKPEGKIVEVTNERNEP